MVGCLAIVGEGCFLDGVIGWGAGGGVYGGLCGGGCELGVVEIDVGASVV